ncbi:hypothetical protein os1_27250 [Comamonadaceae bacterium OS-1]|nr:hypothetical protein os1_27250 [Comamonadaceae bacterium OS-1]
MANIGWGHVMAAAVGGYLNGQQIGQRQLDAEEEKKAKAEDRGYILAQRQRTNKQQGLEDQLQTNLQDAARPVAITEGAGGMVRPATMDNSDVGLPENAALPNGGLLPAGYRVADQAFTDRPQAEAAAAKQNAPEAVNSRVIAAYRGAGQVDKAMQVEGNMRTAELQKMQLADTKWRRDLGGAMQGGHEGLAALATSSEAGPMAGMKVQVIPSADGKVTYGSVDADGKVKPIPGLPSFTNDQNGITQAAFMLDKTITPEARLAHYTAETNRAEDKAQRKSEFDATLEDRKNQHSETVRHNMAVEGLSGRQLSIMASRGSASGKAAAPADAAPFDPLADFDPKQARKTAMDQATEAAKNSRTAMSDTEIAKRAQGIYSALRTAAAADNINMHLQTTVSAAFRKAGSDPEAYATIYDQAQQIARPQQLVAWGFKPPGATGSAKPATPFIAAAQPMALSAPAPAPMDAAGVKVDQARAQLAALRSRPAPGMAAGRTAIDNYAAQVEAARQAVAQAEAEYQRTVPLSGAAFRSPSM